METHTNAPQNTAVPVSSEQARRSSVSSSTLASYTSCHRGIVRWIRETQPNPEVYLDANGIIDVAVFPPALFEAYVLFRFNHADKPVKVATLEGYRSAIKYLYGVRRLPVPIEYEKDLATFFSGLGRIEADRVQLGTVARSGKSPLPYSQYESLCSSTLQLHDGGFAHLFLTTQWNLMCRSKSVETIDTTHLVDLDDSIGCILYKTKTDQEARGPRDPRHIYANPFRPSSCWVTALAIYLACNPAQSPGQLFPGSNQKIRFGKALQRALGKLNDTKMYGTHSIRKGVATFACSGSTSGPSIISVCLRCGWSLGNVQERYFRYEGAGDQYLGRVVAGLPLNSSAFAALPPHFADNDDSDVTWCVQQTFPGMVVDAELLPTLKLCLASLVYHYDFFCNILPSNHALRASFLFRKRDEALALRSRLADPSSTWMRATGVPPHIELYRQDELTRQAVEKIPSVVLDGISTILEENGVRAGHVTTETLRAAIREALVDASVLLPESSVRVVPPPRAPEYYTWNNKFHVLPEKFEFPSVDAFSAWKLWWFGNSVTGWPPFRSINTCDLSTRRKRQTYSEWSCMMNLIADAASASSQHQISKPVTEDQATEVFNIGTQHLPLPASNHKRRWTQLKVTTALRLVRQAIQAANPNSVRRPFKSRKRQKTTA